MNLALYIIDQFLTIYTQMLITRTRAQKNHNEMVGVLSKPLFSSATKGKNKESQSVIHDEPDVSIRQVKHYDRQFSVAVERNT